MDWPSPIERELDTSGLICQQPLLLVKRALYHMNKQGILKLISTDPASRIDIEVFIRQAGHELLHFELLADKVYLYFIRNN